MREDVIMKWNDSIIAYDGSSHCITQLPVPSNLKKYGRFERLQILFLNNKPAYLFTSTQRGESMTSSPFVFKIT